MVRSEPGDIAGSGDGQAKGLRIGVLGPLLVTRDGVEIAPGPAGQRAVLALAALGGLAHRESAIDTLWGESPPATAVAIVQTYVSRLRSLLGPGRDGNRVLIRSGSGYRLQVAADELDLHAFRQLVEAARRARAAGDITEACGACERALALWRGDPLEDIAALREHPAVVALTAERAAVTLEYADLASACGWHEKVLRHLRDLVARDPLDEASCARLMVALAGCGRQAEALKLYEDMRHRLDDQLAVPPGPALRAAHAKVLRQEVPAAEDWRPVFQLPAAIVDFTGRTADCEKLISALTPGDDRRGVLVVVVWGIPGVGKTTLALHAAHQLLARFPDGQLWAHLGGTSARARDPGDVLGDFLRALGVPGPAVPDDIPGRAAQYRSLLAGRRVLVVADDAASAAQVLPLLPGTAGCAVLVTSRVQLDGLAGASLLRLDVMAPDDAVSLLARMTGAERIAAEPAAVGELVRACGALPLALRVVGAKLAARPTWPVSAVLRRLTREHSRLPELEGQDLSVRASIASSYRALSDQARRAFRLLGLLGPADFGEWVPGVLLGNPEGPRLTDELVTRSLLTPVTVGPSAEPRYRLHDLLCDYAGERLADETRASRQAAMNRALEGWLQLARLASARLPSEPRFPPPPACRASSPVPAAVAAELAADPVAWFTAERDNLRTAIEYACTTGQWKLAGQLATCLCGCLFLQDAREEERLWRRIAEAADRTGDEAGAAQASLRSAAATARRGYSAEAAGLLDACIQRFQDAGAHDYLAHALYLRSGCASDLEDYEGASRIADQARTVARQTGNRDAEVFSTQLLGLSLTRSGRHEAGVAACERAKSMAEELDSYVRPMTHSLAFACCIAGQYERALSLSARLFDLGRELNDPTAQASALMVMADAYYELGRFQDALDALSRAEPVFRAHNARRPQALCLLKQGYAHQAIGSAEVAVPLLAQSLAIFRELRLPRKADEAQRALDRCAEQAPDRLSGWLPPPGPATSPGPVR